MLNEKRLEEWAVVLIEVMFSNNTNVHSTTGFTPYFLMFVLEARVPGVILVVLAEMEPMPAAYAVRATPTTTTTSCTITANDELLRMLRAMKQRNAN